MQRCAWSLSSDLMMAYHDNEWCKPSYDNRYIFEMLCLEGMQAGLSWNTILKKRPHYKEAFFDFEVDKVALMRDDDIEVLMLNEGIIRNRLKIKSIINNAVLIKQLDLDLSSFFWGYVDGVMVNQNDDLPATSDLSIRISKDLKAMGFKFVGPTIIYSFMQAIGMVNDHINGCDFK
jgi:DNA-3-methyladenine glycosylase I